MTALLVLDNVSAGYVADIDILRGVSVKVAPGVITTCTEWSCLVNLLAISATLYAAMEAVTPSMMFMGAVSFDILDLLPNSLELRLHFHDRLR